MPAALKQAVMVNIQSHINTTLEFPPVGIVRFMGDNSNGKSVFVKVLQDVVSNNIMRPSNRRSIIRRGNSYGELLIERTDGMTLFVHIDLEAAKTYAELTRPDSQPVRRYLSDKAIPVLVKEFGWHYGGANGVSINIHNDTDGLLFVDTKKSINFDLLNGIRSDAYAEAALEELERLVKTSKQKKQEMDHAHDVAEATYCALQSWDIKEEQRIYEEATYWAGVLECLTVKPVPVFEFRRPPLFLPLVEPVPVMEMPKFYPPFEEVPADAGTALTEVYTIRNGVCPTCQRPFYSGGACDETVVCTGAH